MNKNFFVVALIGFPAALLAQDTLWSKPLDEITVTAQKFPLKTSQTGKVIQIITRQQLEQSGGKDLAQLLNEQVGLSVNGANSNPGKDKSIYLRGARVDHTLITIDGIPVYDPSGIGGNFDIRNLSLDNIERVEILKGSQSTLYGSDAIAGVINIILHKPSTSSLQAKGSLSYGSFHTLRGNLLAEGTQNKISYYAGYSLANTRGINETESKTALTPGDRDGYYQKSVYAGLGITAGNHLKIEPFFRHTKLNGALDQGAFTDEADYTYAQKNTQMGFKSQWTKKQKEVHLIYSYHQIQRTYTDDSTLSRNGYATFEKGYYSGREHFIDLYAHFITLKKIRVTLGSDFRSSNSDQSFYSVSPYGSFSAAYSKDSLHQQQGSLYLAALANPTKEITVEAGGRFNKHSVYGSNTVANINPSFWLRNRLKLFANLSSGYRTPSLFQLFSEYGNRALQPEVALSTEAGAQWYSNNQLFNARITLFKRRVKNVIFFYFDASTGRSEYINQDLQSDLGSELELTLQPNRYVQLRIFHTFVTGQLTTQQNAKDTTYFNLLRRPKNSLGLAVTASLTPQLQISSSMNYYSKRRDAYFDSETFETVYTQLQPYFLWDLYLSYRTDKRFTFFADLRNITNSTYTEISGFRTMRFNAYTGIRIAW